MFEPITWSNAKKIKQAFILHLQNWIDSVQPSFVVLQDSFEEWLFGGSEVNICMIEAANEVARSFHKFLPRFIYYF